MPVAEHRDPQKRDLGRKLPTRPQWHPSYAHHTLALAEACAKEIGGRVVVDEWDPLDGEGPRRQWLVKTDDA